jgi:hypothetical protein
MTIFGWDASDFDWDRGPMDLGAARAAGIDFFTHKATEGTGTRHRHYGEALERARAAGVPFLGAYHVVRSTSSVAAQVDFCLGYVDAKTPWWREHPGWFFQCDLEHWPHDKVPPSVGVQWCERMEARTGRRVLLYAPRRAGRTATRSAGRRRSGRRMGERRLDPQGLVPGDLRPNDWPIAGPPVGTSDRTRPLAAKPAGHRASVRVRPGSNARTATTDRGVWVGEAPHWEASEASAGEST